jgi:hypothetical protein
MSWDDWIETEAMQGVTDGPQALRSPEERRRYLRVVEADEAAPSPPVAVQRPLLPSAPPEPSERPYAPPIDDVTGLRLLARVMRARMGVINSDG